MWVVLIKKFKFGKQTKSKRYTFKDKEEAEHFAHQQEDHAEIYKSEFE